MRKRRKLRGFDLRQIYGFDSLIGVDEAGRGALAGPVVAAAVLVTQDFLEGRWAITKANRVNDSKQLTAAVREELWAEFDRLAASRCIHASTGVASVAEIETLNILGATKLAMHRAIEGIYPPAFFQSRSEPELFPSASEQACCTQKISCRILIDGLSLRDFSYPHTGVVNGDARSLCVAMASIIAKVTRDRLMDELDRAHPGYGLAQHKGYGTEDHRMAVLKLGRSAIHRDTFLRKLLAKTRDLEGQMTLFS
ncbi:MAG: ribonuclease HII [Opitutaceae bacterium]|nr:ribonuclease HII [Opitutaceae bacterium]